MTLASHEFFNPKWSPKIRSEWMRNLAARMQTKTPGVDPQPQVEKIAAAIRAAFPDAEVAEQLPESEVLAPVDVKDRHVVMTAVAAHAEKTASDVARR